MTGDFAGKVAIVTGGANGIGRAVVERLVADGARVVVADVDADLGEKVAGDLGERASFRQVDVSDLDEVTALVADTVDRLGALDVMCNVAGVSGSLRRFLDDDLRDFQKVASIDLYGVLACCRAAALHMVDHGGGSIVNVASGAGITPGVGMVPYRAAKAGVVHVTRCLAVELGDHGIRVNAVAPANIATTINEAFDKAAVRRLLPLPHQGRTDDVVEAVAYLAGDRAAHVTGVVVPVDGGMAVGTPPRP